MKSEWIYVPLGDILTLQRGHDLPSDKREDGIIPIIGSAGITGFHSEAKMSGPGVVIGRSGNSMGNISFTDIDYWPLNTGLYVKDFKANNCKYIYYLLKTINFDQFNSGSAQKSLNRNFVYPYQVYITTNILEQQKIAHILSTLDDKIELNRQMNQTLEAMAQALFQSWFVDFDPVHAKAGCRSDAELEHIARELGISKEVLELFPSAFVESEMGMIPEGWETYPIGDITTVTIGKTPPRKEQHWFTTNADDVKWVSIKDMGNSGTYITNTSEYLTSDAIDKFNVKVVPTSTVILSFKMTVGRVSITTEDMCTNEAIAHFALDGRYKLSPNYLYCHLKNFDYNSLGSTSSIATAVNSKIVRTIPTIVPSEEVIQLFNDQVENIFEQILVTTNEIQTLQQTRDTLLPKLLSGELDVSELKITEEN